MFITLVRSGEGGGVGWGGMIWATLICRRLYAAKKWKLLVNQNWPPERANRPYPSKIGSKYIKKIVSSIKLGHLLLILVLILCCIRQYTGFSSFRRKPAEAQPTYKTECSDWKQPNNSKYYKLLLHENAGCEQRLPFYRYELLVPSFFSDNIRFLVANCTWNVSLLLLLEP